MDLKALHETKLVLLNNCYETRNQYLKILKDIDKQIDELRGQLMLLDELIKAEGGEEHGVAEVLER